jgi:hypothetical protein
MKPYIRVLALLVLVLVSAAGGFFLGKSQSVAVTRSEGDNSLTGYVTNSRPAVKRSGASTIDTKELRAALDREKSPLARYKLASQNLEAWVEKSPRDALDWLVSQQATARRDEVIQIALNQYAANDAKGAADWALKNLTGADLNNTLITIAEHWAQGNGQEAAAWFLSLPVTMARDGAVENIFFSWASTEPAAALEYLNSNPSIGDLAPILRRAALAGWAKSDPEGAVAASLALSRANNDPAQFANTVANWATVDLESSSQWLLTNLQGSNERTSAAQELANIFAHQSPDAGITWLGKLNAGAERDAAANALAASWARSGPADAAKWAASQSSITFSPDTILQVAHNFMMKDPEAFQAWSSALPEGPLKTQVSQAAVMAEDE